MDTRLIFRDLELVRWRDGVLYCGPIIGLGSVPRECFPGKSGRYSSSGMEMRRPRPKLIHRSALPRKTSKHNQLQTVPKPTQVICSSRVRRTSERSSRNSAKKRPYVSNKVRPFRASGRGRSENFPGDCLPKTQLPANS